MNFKTLRIADEGMIRTITMHRPERRNAMTPEMQKELIAAFEETARSTARVLVLTGADNAFCSGMDLSSLKEISDRSLDEHRESMERIARLFLALYELTIPTIAAVHGPAVGGGAGLATICDFTLASHDAKFGFTEVRIGFVPALVSTFLELMIGGKHARDLMLTGRIINADEAYRMGLVNKIVPHAELTNEVNRLAADLIANGPEAIAITKRLLMKHHRAWIDAAFEAGLDASAESRQTADFREGISAFLGKRKPSWSK